MSIVNTLALESNRQIKINLDGGDLSSDAGLLLIKEFVSKLGIDKLFSHSFKTNDSASFRYHTDKENLLQMIYMIIAGYFEDFSYDASKSYLINGKRKNKWWLLYQFENGKVQIDKKIGKKLSVTKMLDNIENKKCID